MRYRPEIDGLRAIAVVPVILYHAGWRLCSGGYVGVDIFFVISGYLITSLLIDDLDSRNFSILKFYERRFRRIIPPLAVMVLIVAALSWRYLLPRELVDLGRSMAALATFWANIYFYKQTGYFDIEAGSKPLLHTWSLSIEEQFYIIFPIILYYIFKYHRQKLPFYLAILTFLSFIAGAGQVHVSRSGGFYLLQYRAWELLAGALLASLHCNEQSLIPKALGSQLPALTGLILITWPVISYTNQTLFPGLSALPVILGTLILIDIFREKADGPIGRILSARPLVGIGKISYALYLWHWPLLVIPTVVTNQPMNHWQVALILAATLILSIASWYLIEQPVRKKKIFTSRQAVMIFSFGCIMLMAIFGRLLRYNSGFPSRLNAQAVAYLSQADVDRQDAAKCDKNARSKDLSPCVVGRPSQKPSFIVWGDSHAGAWLPALNALASEYNVSGLLHTMSSCPPLLNFKHSNRTEKANNRCQRFNEALFDLVDAHQITDVCLAATFTAYVEGRTERPPTISDSGEPYSLDESRSLFRDMLQNTLNLLNQKGVRVWIVQGVPEYPVNVTNALAQMANSRDGVHIENLALDSSVYLKQSRFINSAIDNFKESAVFLPLEPPLCDTEKCRPADRGGSYYRDGHHLSSYGAKHLKNTFKPMFQVIPKSDR